MARLIELAEPASLPGRLTMTVGDVLTVAATGGRVTAGAGAVELLGAFLPAVVGPGGDVVAPMGAPGTVLFIARRAGRASVDVMTGDPFGAARATTLELVVED